MASSSSSDQTDDLANALMTTSNQPINDQTNVTYPELRERVKDILCCDCMEIEIVKSKDTVDKEMILQMVAWMKLYLLEHNEPDIVLIISGDVDFCCAILEAKQRKFRIMLTTKLQLGD